MGVLDPRPARTAHIYYEVQAVPVGRGLTGVEPRDRPYQGGEGNTNRLAKRLLAQKWREPMAKLADFVPGTKFPDLALPDHTGTVVRLSDLTGGRDPLAVVFYRGWY